jgi:hypothetical protein
VYLVSLALALQLMGHFTSVVAFVALTALSGGWALAVGARTWFRGQLRVNIGEAFLVKEEVKILPAGSLGNFRIVVTPRRHR